MIGLNAAVPIRIMDASLHQAWMSLSCGAASGPRLPAEASNWRLRGFVVAVLALLLLIPVAHQVWDADAPGRCIRTLKAFDRTEHKDPLHDLVANLTRPAAYDACYHEKATIEEFEESDEVCPSLATFETIPPPIPPGPRPSGLARSDAPVLVLQRLRC